MKILEKPWAMVALMQNVEGLPWVGILVWDMGFVQEQILYDVVHKTLRIYDATMSSQPQYEKLVTQPTTPK